MKIKTPKEVHYGKKEVTLSKLNLYVNLIVLATVAIIKLLDKFIGFGMYINIFDIIAVIISIIGIGLYFSKKSDGIVTILTSISLLAASFVCFKSIDPLKSHFNIFMMVGIIGFIVTTIIFRFNKIQNDNNGNYTLNPNLGLAGALTGIVISISIVILGGMLSDNYYGGTIKVECAMMIMLFAIVYAAVGAMEIKKLKGEKKR